MHSTDRTKKTSTPTLRSIEDIRGGVDLEKVVNLGMLYELGVDNNHDETHARMGVWHPSSVDMCKRRQVMLYTRVAMTDLPAVRLKEIFEFGHMVHELVQRRFEKLAPHAKRYGLHYEFEREVKFDESKDQLFLEFHIAGTADGILRIWNSLFEQRSVLEAKSQGTDRHDDMLKLKTPAWPKHLKQAHLYAYRFDIPLIYTFYLNKNNCKRVVTPHVFEWAIFDEALLYFDVCNDYVRRGELPAREESWLECNDCEYRTMCKPEVLKYQNGQTIPTKQITRRKK